MKAVVYTHARPVEAEDALIDADLPEPVPHRHDLLVEVKAIAVNPVDAKLRRHADPVGEPRVLGFDAAGIVRAIGPEVRHFGVGDAVWFAGSINRPGSYAELTLVDERIAARKPASLSFAEAAALPLTALTAWEMLFERFGLAEGGGAGKSLLVIGGAGGVGTMALQLARALTGLRIIATASRPESRDWCASFGAHEVIDHHADMVAALRGLGLKGADYVFVTRDSDRHWPAIPRLVAPFGHVGLIDDPAPIDVRELKPKSASLHWEAVFTRPLLGTPDMIAQHVILERLADLVDEGRIRTTLRHHLGPINAANLIRAHRMIESGHTHGKIVLEGFA